MSLIWSFRGPERVFRRVKRVRIVVCFGSRRHGPKSWRDESGYNTAAMIDSLKRLRSYRDVTDGRLTSDE